MNTHGIEVFLHRALEKPLGLIGAVVSVVAAAVGLEGPLPSVTAQPELVIPFWLIVAAIGGAVGWGIQSIAEDVIEARRKKAT